MSIKQILNWATLQIKETSKSARLDAEVLLLHVIKKSPTYLIAYSEQKISSINLFKFKRLIHKRKQGIPVSYLTKHKEFYDLDFYVNRQVLIPRPDTEILVEAVINYIKQEKPINAVLIDIGTGSGCVPISVLKNTSNLNAMAIDISGKALKVAQKNAQKHQVSNRLKFLLSDLLKNVKIGEGKTQNIILTANLPYLPLNYRTNDLDHEPSLALYSGDEGVDHYYRLLSQIDLIKPKIVFFECFDFQVEAILSKATHYQQKTIKKMTNQAVCLILERKDKE